MVLSLLPLPFFPTAQLVWVVGRSWTIQPLSRLAGFEQI